MGFVQTKASEAVELLSASREKKDGKDKRRAPRSEIRTPLSILVSQSIEAELQDLSARGVCLIVDAPIEQGSQFTLLLPSKPGTSRAPVLCRVVHCRRQPEGVYKIGAEFLGSVETMRLTESESAAQAERIRESILR